jgi:N-acetyl sugar amidotransferase
MQVCTRCIYDEHIPDISFDEHGVCNYCRQHDMLEREYPTGEQGEKILQDLAEKIKKTTDPKKKYNVIVGVSGGCDSSYLLWKTIQLGLKPIAVHFDNTWNSKTAVENIHNIIKKLGVDLFTLVVNNEEYNDIFRSFLKASVPDIDTPSDLGLAATHYIAAEKLGIKYIFEGHSFRTEGISPPGWFYIDGRYIKTVHDAFGIKKMKTFPNMSLGKFLKWTIFNNVKKIRPLYYMDYDKEKTKQFLMTELGWKWYGGHHMENRTSYFTNNYYLPTKFKIDLRYSEFSALVRTGQMSRDEALLRIKESKPIDKGLIDEVKKRLGFSDAEFQAIMEMPRKYYTDYRTYKQTFESLKPLFWMMYKANLVTKSFYMKYTKKYKQNLGALYDKK